MGQLLETVLEDIVSSKQTADISNQASLVNGA
jgi:hypothetical protein